MARTTRDGEVYLTGVPVDGDDVLAGNVAKLEDGRWQAVCALDEEHVYIGDLKGWAIHTLEEHFVKDHTTLQL